MLTFDYLIVGSGFAGLSTAYFLLKKKAGRILIMEKAPKPGSEASGKNASMLRQITDNVVLTRMAVEGTKLLREEFAPRWPRIHCRTNGSLLLVGQNHIERLKSSIQAALSHGVPVEFLKRDEIIDRFPLLRDAQFERGIFNAEDGVVDIHALCESLARYVQGKKDARFIASRPFDLKRIHEGLFEIDSPEGTIRARTVVNAAGAWADAVARQVGARPVGLESFRRHIFVTEKLEGISPDWPFIWDLTHEIYFRPEDHALLLSPCDEEPMAPGPTPVSSDIEALCLRKTLEVLPSLKEIRYARSWAGLRTFAPDRKFVIGWDRTVPGFFWVAGLGGHGLTACASVGRLAACLLMKEDLRSDLAGHFAPTRFEAP